MPTAIAYPLPTGHTAGIAVNAHPTREGTAYAYSAIVTDQLGTSLTLAYGAGAPSARAAYRACDGAVRDFARRAQLAARFGFDFESRIVAVDCACGCND